MFYKYYNKLQVTKSTNLVQIRKPVCSKQLAQTRVSPVKHLKYWYHRIPNYF